MQQLLLLAVIVSSSSSFSLNPHCFGTVYHQEVFAEASQLITCVGDTTPTISTIINKDYH